MFSRNFSRSRNVLRSQSHLKLLSPSRYSGIQHDAYSVTHSTPQPAYFRKVVEKTVEDYSKAIMMVSQPQGSLLTFLCKLMNADKVLEVGCFTGYSALCLAEGIKERGSSAKVVSCENNEEYAKVALQNVREAGMSELVEIRVGDALDTLRNFERSTHFDLIFIDANKSGYVNYYDTILEYDLLSKNGIIVADNVLYTGYAQKVPHYDPNAPESSESYIPKEIYNTAKHLHKFNEHVTKDPRTTNLLMPGFDGLMLIRKNQ